MVGAIDAKDMAFPGSLNQIDTQQTWNKKTQYLQVVTSARSRTSTRHFMSLHLRAWSMFPEAIRKWG